MGVYILESNGKFKIGFAQNLEQRIRTLQVGNPYEITPVAWLKECRPPDSLEMKLPKRNTGRGTHIADSLIERQIHLELHPHREYGEWFCLTRPQLEIIINKYQFVTFANASHILGDGVIDRETNAVIIQKGDWTPSAKEIELENEYQQKIAALEVHYAEKYKVLQEKYEQRLKPTELLKIPSIKRRFERMVRDQVRQIELALEKENNLAQPVENLTSETLRRFRSPLVYVKE